MPTTNPVLDFLKTRRSVPAKLHQPQAPDRAALAEILGAALRIPDHGKLEPWRLIVLERAALVRLGALAQQRGPDLGIEPDRIAKGALQFSQSHLAVAVVAVPRPTEKIPAWEQQLSAGALCFAILAATQSAGWAANWLTGWAAYDPEFCQRGLGLAAGERIAGLIHIGSHSGELPPDRPRPDPARVIAWAAD